jgi:hypothetical protein
MIVRQRIANVDILGYIHRLTYIPINYTYVYVHTYALLYG